MRHLVLVWVLVMCTAAVADDAANSEETGVARFLSSAQEVIDGALASGGTVEAIPEGEPLVLTAERCVTLALAQNAQAYIAEAKVVAAKARIGQAQSARLPQVSARAASTYMTGLETDLGTGILGQAIEYLALGSDWQGSKDTHTFQFDVKQVIYAGGQIAAAQRASKYLAKSEEWQREVALDMLTYQAEESYYDTLLARALVRVAEESIIAFERHVDDAQQAFDVGLIGNFEILRARTELGKRHSDAISARNAARLSQANLCRLLAVPQNTAIEFEGKLDWRPLETPMSDMLAEALSQRAELKALEQGVEAAEENIARVRGEYKPKVAATAQWSRITGGSRILPDDWTFGVGAEWELYAGGRRKNQVTEAKAQLEQIEYQIEDVRRLVELDVQQAYIRVQNAISTIRRDKGTVELGLEGRRLATLRFQEGVGTQAEILDAELAVTAAETSLVQALRDYAVAHAALEKALGRGPAKRETLAVDGGEGEL